MEGKRKEKKEFVRWVFGFLERRIRNAVNNGGYDDEEEDDDEVYEYVKQLLHIY